MPAQDIDLVIDMLQTARTAGQVLDRLMSGFADFGLAGVAYCSAGVAAPQVQGQRSMLQWAKHYEHAGYQTQDPVVLGLLRTGGPMLWHAERPLPAFSALQRRIFGEAGEHGLHSGISVPVHVAGQMHVLGLFSAEQLPHDHERLARLNYAALLAHERMRELSQRLRTATVPASVLSPRERDCLNWTKEGLTAAEIADKLKLSERTVIHHLQSAKARLGARNLPHAVARAIATGELLL